MDLPSYGLVGADFYKQIKDYKGEYNTSMFVYPSEEHSHNKVNKDLIPYSKVISKMKNLSIAETEKYKVTVNPFIEFYFKDTVSNSKKDKNLYVAVNLYPVEKQGDKYSQVYDDLSEESVLSKVNFTTAITHPAPTVRFEIAELKDDIEPIVVNYEGTLKDKDLKRVGEALSKVNPKVLKFRLETTDNPDVIKMYNIFNRDPIEVNLKGKIVRKTLNESNQTPISWSVDVVVPHDKVYVANENTLTEQEKEAIKNEIVKVNQENRITKDMISVSDEGKATITYSDGSQDEISKDKLITNQKPKVDIAVGDDKLINNNVSVGVNTETNTEKIPSDKSTQTDKNTIDKGTQTDLMGRDIDKLKSDATRDNSIISELEKLKDELTRMNERSIPRDVEIGQWYPDVMKRLPDKRSYIDGEDILLNGMQMIFSRYVLVGNKYEKQTEVVNFSDFRNEYRGWKFNLKTPKALLRDSEGGKMRVRFSFTLNNKNESMR